MSSSVLVVRPGLFTTVQDCGRWGWQSRGVSVSGPMDPVALRVANALVGNQRSDAALEITLTGPELRFDDRRLVAVAGASVEVLVDEVPIPAHEAVVVPAGSGVRVGRSSRGARAYLAIAGGIGTPPVLGSRATHVPSALGGVHGRPLRSGDRLPLGPARTDARPGPPAQSPLRTPDDQPLRFIAGPDWHDRTDDALAVLQEGSYRVESESNRMGYRLHGRALPAIGAVGYVSDITPLGVVQVPPSGQPILLMADRQTTGGYPRLGIVITADIGVAGQARPGDELRFERCSAETASAALMAVERRLVALETAL